MEFDEILEVLCRAVPEAIGAALCDFEGETVVSALGRAGVPPEAIVRAKEHVPRNLELSMPVAQFLVRLAGAEPCALLEQFATAGRAGGAGAIAGLEARYGAVETLVERLPEDFYVVVVLRRPAVLGRARHHLRRAAAALAPHLI